MGDYIDTINAHYASEDLFLRLLKAFKKTGKDPNQLSIEDLAPVDEFHIAGRDQTLKLGQMADLSETDSVIDIGCGLGGPARTIARHFGCRVTGIDLTKEYCEAGNRLSRLVGLSNQVILLHGNALNLPVEAHTFHVAWMQHVTMNISAKQQLFQEIKRVLQPGGRLVFYEVTTGENPSIAYPVPWSQTSELSFLQTAADLEAGLSSTGFKKTLMEDVTEQSIRWFYDMRNNRNDKGSPRVNLTTLMGPTFPLMAKNLLKNLENKSLRVIQGIYRISI